MKPKSSSAEWQPVDLVDKEAVQPLCSYNSLPAPGDHHYYTLDGTHSSVYNTDAGFLPDDDSDSSEVYTQADPIEDGKEKKERKRWLKIKILVALLLLMVFCLVIVVILQHVRTEKDEQVCVDQECVKASAYILNKIDDSVDPCDNFYNYACGNWMKTTHIPSSKPKYGSFATIADDISSQLKTIIEADEQPYKGVQSRGIHKMYQLYKMCMDTDQIDKDGNAPTLKLLKRLGGWTMMSDPDAGSFDPNKWNIQDAILVSHRLDFNPLFSMTVGVDERNSSRYQIKFEQSGTTLTSREDYLPSSSRYQSLKDGFIAFADAVVKLLGGTDYEQKVNDIYAFEQDLARIFVPREQLIDREKIYNKMTLQTFQDKYFGDWLDLKTYMRGSFEGIREIPMSTEVVVYTPQYFTDLQDLLDDTDDETLANYMGWQVVLAMLGYMPEEFAEASLLLDKVQTGVKEYPPRWKRCLAKTTGTFGFALSALYVDRYFAESSKTEVEELFLSVRDAFISNLDSLQWMDDATRNYAREKAEAVDKMIAYPDYITDPAKLDKHYENVTLVNGQFFESRLSTLHQSRQKNLRHITEAPKKDEWDMFPTEVNAYYSADFNHIVFTAGILNPPLFNPTAAKSVNFGSFGMISGHELTHGFDNKGRVFDKDGNMRNWWTEASSRNFQQHSQCFIDFYGNYTYDGTNLNGVTTLSENIADNGGMKMGYLAFKEWQRKNSVEDSFTLPGMSQTPDQLFFLGMAQLWCSYYMPEYVHEAIQTDDHSIAKFRVLGTMSNSPEFAKAFNCPSGSKMNPPKKCSVW